MKTKITKQLEIYKQFYKKIKDMVRDSGRTNVLSLSAVDEEVVATGNKIFEVEK